MPVAPVGGQQSTWAVYIADADAALPGSLTEPLPAGYEVAGRVGHHPRLADQDNHGDGGDWLAPPRPVSSCNLRFCWVDTDPPALDGRVSRPVVVEGVDEGRATRSAYPRVTFERDVSNARARTDEAYNWAYHWYEAPAAADA